MGRWGTPRPARAVVGGCVAVALLVACSGASTTSTPTPTATATATSVVAVGDAGPRGSAAPGSVPGTAPGSTVPVALPAAGSGASSPADCHRTVAPATAKKVAGSDHDLDLTSFDGTRIRLHWFPLSGAKAAPTVLMGPGWGLPGDTNVDSIGVLGAIDIHALQTAGYNVLTWDPRGFGQSDGVASVDSADLEGRDVQKMIDWIATQPAVALDAPGDPQMGMAGGSYGGGIQFVTAAHDCRVDAIVPVIAWNSLATSLDKNDTPKTGWAGLLGGIAKTRPVDPHVTSATQSGLDLGVISADDKAWFVARGPADQLGSITVPTLLIQGTVDTLFTLDEAVSNYRALRERGVPVSMVWFCGGHGACLTDPGDPQRVQQAAISWLNRYVKRDTKVDTRPAIDVIDQNGTRHHAADYPLPAGPPITASGTGVLTLAGSGGSGPVTMPATPGDLLSGLVAPITPAKATNALNIPITAGSDPAIVVGAPTLTLSYHGASPAGARPTRAFAQIVDDATGIVLGNQVTPIAVELDGANHQLEVPLEVVAFAAKPGAALTLQIVATTVAYTLPRLGGTITFDQIAISLPTATGLTPG